MLDGDSNPMPTNVGGLAFRAVFTTSRIPMSLVDHHRRYVEVNDAFVETYGYPRSELLGSLAGHKVVGGSSSPSDVWKEFLDTGELYGERLVGDGDHRQLLVSYAAHATMFDGRWLALFVTLSARRQPDGVELIGGAKVERPTGLLPKLTHRELEVVRHVALGRNTRQIAIELQISSATVRTHIRNVMEKTGAHTRAQLIAVVLADGMIERE
jgi:PAS domain S-box-containing protein